MATETSGLEQVKKPVWIQPIQGKLAALRERSLKSSIFKVPDKLRKGNEDAYSPRIVSIGPFHSSITTRSLLQQTWANKENHLRAEEDDRWRHMLSLVQQTQVKKHDHLQAMEEHKWWYTLYLIHRAQDPEEQNPEEILKECGAVLEDEDLDKSVRGSYAGNIKLQLHELSEIMLIDGCFILELFIRSWQHHQEEDGDPIFHNNWMVPTLQQDLALLENQVPFFILQKLYDIVRHLFPLEHDGSIPSITELAVNFFYPDLKSKKEALFREKCRKAGKDFKHLLDLLYKFHLPTYPEIDPQGKKESESRSNPEPIREKCMSTSLEIDPEGQESWGFKKCATTLSEAGIEFEKGTDVSLLGIEFDKGVIKIPPLSIDGKTESLLGNLIAFEQCSPESKHHVSSYIVLLKSLVGSIQDIKLLKQKEIITPNWVGDENVLIFFNNTSREIKPKDFCFGDLCDKVKADEKSWWHWHRIKAFCKVRSRTYWKDLKRDYFSTPWSFISFIAALVLLALTIVQTYYSVRSYLHPH